MFVGGWLRGVWWIWRSLLLLLLLFKRYMVLESIYIGQTGFVGVLQ